MDNLSVKIAKPEEFILIKPSAKDVWRKIINANTPYNSLSGRWIIFYYYYQLSTTDTTKPQSILLDLYDDKYSLLKLNKIVNPTFKHWIS